jgi:hypothetical protein
MGWRGWNCCVFFDGEERRFGALGSYYQKAYQIEYTMSSNKSYNCPPTSISDASANFLIQN